MCDGNSDRIQLWGGQGKGHEPDKYMKKIL